MKCQEKGLASHVVHSVTFMDVSVLCTDVC